MFLYNEGKPRTKLVDKGRILKRIHHNSFMRQWRNSSFRFLVFKDLVAFLWVSFHRARVYIRCRNVGLGLSCLHCLLFCPTGLTFPFY